jgi:general secretion pathway protein G
MKKAFTMIELVFVIVVIGILAGVAIPKFAATRDDAFVSKGRAEVAALRSAIATERQKRILRGNFDAITDTEAPGLLEYNLSSKWSGLTFTGPDGTTCTFTVNNNKLEGPAGGCQIPGMTDF